MGLFKTKKKKVVDTAIVRLVENDDIIDLVPPTLINGIMGSGDIPGEMADLAMNSSARGFERMYRYAERGDYFYGLPDVKVRRNNEGAEIAEGILRGIYGQQISIDYIHYRPINNFHEGWRILRDQYEYSHKHNLLVTTSIQKQAFVVLSKIVAVHQSSPGDDEVNDDWMTDPTNTMGDQDPTTGGGLFPGLGDPIQPVGLGALIVQTETRSGPYERESVELHLAWQDADGAYHDEMIVHDLTAYGGEKEFYQAKVRWEDSDPEKEAHIEYWTYDPADGQYPQLDGLFDLNYINPGTYFPFALFRRDGRDRTDQREQDRNPEAFETSQKLLKYIGIDFEEMGAQINENPDIDAIEQAVFMMAVSLNSQHEDEIDYLHRYFSDLHERLPEAAKNRMYNMSAVFAQYAYKDNGDESYAIEISDGDYRVVMSFDAITKQYRGGRIGETDENGWGIVGNVENEYNGVDLGDGDARREGKLQTVQYIRKQITPSVYEEIRVINGKMRYDMGVGKDVYGGGDDPKVLIPLDYNICREMSMRKRESLYFRSMHLVFNSFVIQKTKWYQKGWFKAILVVVAIVITIYSMGATWQLAVAAAGAGAGLAAIALIFLQMVITNIAIGFAISTAFSIVVEELGLELGFIIAAVVIVASFTYGYANGSEAQMLGKVTAENLLTVGTGLVSGVNKATENLMEDLIEKGEEFAEYTGLKMEELEQAEALLSNSNIIDPFAFIGKEPMFIPGESSDAYFGRTVHSGNIGINGIKIVENFVDQSLTLPDLSENYGDFT